MLDTASLIRTIRDRGHTHEEVAAILKVRRPNATQFMNGKRALKHDEALALVRWLGLDVAAAPPLPEIGALEAVARCIAEARPEAAELSEAWIAAAAIALRGWLEEQRTDPSALTDPRDSQRLMRAMMRVAFPHSHKPLQPRSRR